MEDNLEEYINKYDMDFSINNLNLERYKKYQDIYSEDNDKIFSLIKILIQWNYDNVFYSRRQSQKNLVNLCEGYLRKGEKYFKQQLENFFKITDDTLVLDYIANNPNDFEAIRNLILADDNVNIKKLKSGLARYLESYRYNTALNLLSGLFGLITNEFDNTTKARFIESFNIINEKDNEYKEELLNISLDVGQTLDKKQRNILGEILNTYYNEKYIIYEKIMDDSSLNNILEEKINKLDEIGEILNG